MNNLLTYEEWLEDPKAKALLGAKWYTYIKDFNTEEVEVCRIPITDRIDPKVVIEKLKEYIYYLEKHKSYQTSIETCGDIILIAHNNLNNKDKLEELSKEYTMNAYKDYVFAYHTVAAQIHINKLEG